MYTVSGFSTEAPVVGSGAGPGFPDGLCAFRLAVRLAVLSDLGIRWPAGTGSQRRRSGGGGNKISFCPPPPPQ